MKSERQNQAGFSLLEIAIAVLIVVILVAVVLLQVLGVFGGARDTSLEIDLRNVKTAVDAYMVESLQAPTQSGGLPETGSYALIDFEAGFQVRGQTKTLHPHFLSALPRHWDEGVWRIDSSGIVTVSIESDEY